MSDPESRSGTLCSIFLLALLSPICPAAIPLAFSDLPYVRFIPTISSSIPRNALQPPVMLVGLTIAILAMLGVPAADEPQGLSPYAITRHPTVEPWQGDVSWRGLSTSGPATTSAAPLSTGFLPVATKACTCPRGTN
ncbi:hypothetical protein BOTBODRAFT_187468 [Botryobasidium botryosum FD-172 SS1]|uniref:Uncharacterized protein n=1 Tax=Botryobasidium botryosum (strain FD-172 SS1) TaxID=930990 RepID=A0A067MTY5_BOTB1|nr:hypothetical protein BOTBODRAFT_187468 [Botryobasidium botryosum FD-172 SS1]